MTGTLAEFVSTTTGQSVSYDGIKANQGQCLQVVEKYCVDVLGITPPETTAAADYWNDFESLGLGALGFTQVPVGQPIQPGDFVVFGASASINSPKYGHIDICINETAGGYLGFDSNWGGDNNAAGYPVAHEVQHTFDDVLGYLRFNGGDMSDIVDLSTARILAFCIGGRNGFDNSQNALNGDCDADLTANHVGKDVLVDIDLWYNSTEGTNFRDVLLPNVYYARDSEKVEIASLTAELATASVKPTPLAPGVYSVGGS